MKELVDHDLFDQIADSDAICITTNCTLLEDGTNPMGGGCAGAAVKHWPTLERVYGYMLQMTPHVPCILGYADQNDIKDFVLPDDLESFEGLCAIVAYPTMHDITEAASLDLVIRSAELLSEMADVFGWNKVVVPRPGSGIGGLDWETEVKPAIKDILDDRFTLIHKDFAPKVFKKSMKSWTSTTKW